VPGTACDVPPLKGGQATVEVFQYLAEGTDLGSTATRGSEASFHRLTDLPELSSGVPDLRAVLFHQHQQDRLPAPHGLFILGLRTELLDSQAGRSGAQYEQSWQLERRPLGSPPANIT
jgi:hypothetical protein